MPPEASSAMGTYGEVGGATAHSIASAYARLGGHDGLRYSSTVSAVDEALDQAWRGDLRPAQASYESATVADRARIEVAEWLAGARAEPPPAPSGIAGEPRAVALAWVARAHVVRLGFDAEGLREARAGMREALAALPADDLAHAWGGAVELWWQVSRGEATEASFAEARALEGRAAAGGDAALVLELASLRALVALSIGDLDRATREARRASRMARTEALPQSEYLANVVLARVRRHADRPHLAVRILGALRRVAPAPWHAWLDWELRLAGDRVSCDRAHVVDVALDAAERGDRDAFEGALVDGRPSVAGFALARRDLEALAYSLDVTRRGDGPWVAEAERWRMGERPRPPHGLQAVERARTSASDGTVAYVVAAPGGAGRRVLRAGLTLSRGGEPWLVLEPSARKRGRLETAACALLLAGDAGLEEPALFHDVYGFPFDETQHVGILDVVLHRLRKQLAGRGEVSRRGSRVRLTHRGICAPDPRCSQLLDDRVLAQLARRGAASAQDTAKALALPLRTVQHVLKRLATDGVCVPERRGRRVEYVLEDTTFSEPTTH